MPLCECGCGQETKSNHRGKPNRFIVGHNMKFLLTEWVDRFWSKVEKTETCWLWKGTKSKSTSDIYGAFPRKIDGKTAVRRAHRVAYELVKGPIPDGLVIDHLCRNPLCVNPDHLEPVTQQENTLRGIGPSAKNAVKTECDKGHPFDDENTYWYKGYRACKECKRESVKYSSRRRRAKLRGLTNDNASE